MILLFYSCGQSESRLLKTFQGILTYNEGTNKLSNLL
jgi:hypothetical protein